MALPEPGEVLSSMQIPTSSLRRPAKMVKDTALGLRSPLSLRQLTQEVQNIRLQLCCSGLTTAKILETSPTPSLTTSVCWDMAHQQRQADLDVEARTMRLWKNSQGPSAAKANLLEFCGNMVG